MIKILILFLFILTSKLNSFEVNWELIETNNTNRLIHVYFINDNMGFTVGWKGTILKTTNQGLNWEIIYINSSTQFNKVFFLDSLTGWVGGQKGFSEPTEFLYFTQDGGKTWKPINVNATHSICGIYFVDTNNGFIVDRGSNVFSTSDNGVNWHLDTSLNVFLSGLYCESKTAWLFGSSGVLFKSDNNFKNWKKIETKTTESIYCFAKNDNNIWIGGNNGYLQMTTNEGNDWQAIDSKTSEGLFTLGIINKDKIIFGGGFNSGILAVSNDGGLSWVFQDYPNQQSILSIKIINDNIVIAVCSDGKIIRGTLKKSNIFNKKINNNQDNKINIFPNPLENSQYLTFKFDIDKKLHAQIELLDNYGRKIIDICSGEYENGIYTFEQQFNSLNSGLYYIKILFNHNELYIEPVVILN